MRLKYVQRVFQTSLYTSFGWFAVLNETQVINNQLKELFDARVCMSKTFRVLA